MTDRLALWDRLMTLASKANKAIDASSKISYSKNPEELMQSSTEEKREHIQRADGARSLLLHLLLTDCMATSDGTQQFDDEPSVSDRLQMLKEENKHKMAAELFNDFPLGRLFVRLEESEGNDDETSKRVQEVRRVLLRALQLLIDSGVTPSAELLGSFEQQKMFEEARINGMSTFQWLERQRSLNRKGRKRKQEVDTKASKGRKIRYVEIPKLVNFFPATPEEVPWSDQKREELFKSLFV